MLKLVAVASLFVLVYVLPIVHVARSPRTPPKMKTFFCLAIALTGLLGYLLWWMMTVPQPVQGLDPAQIPPFPKQPEPGTALVYVLRSSFFGALVNYHVYVDDRDAEVARIRGSRYAILTVSPGKHVLWIRAYRWLEFPFEANAGEVLAFSLDAQTETPLTNTVAGWLDELNARRRLARLRA